VESFSSFETEIEEQMSSCIIYVEDILAIYDKNKKETYNKLRMNAKITTVSKIPHGKVTNIVFFKECGTLGRGYCALEESLELFCQQTQRLLPFT
jgi:hypothetical protein